MALALGGLGLGSSAARAQSATAAEEAELIEEMVIEGSSAGISGVNGRSWDSVAVEGLPGRASDDLLRVMPGLHQSSHGGRGKAYQYFLRGFDAVHGSDIAVSLEGVPLNEVSNVHGHGYLDLQILPTALVSGISAWPGTFRPEEGDFAVAGSLALRLGLPQAGLRTEAGGGTDRSGVALVTWRPPQRPAESFALAEVDAGQGVGEGRDWQQARVALGASRGHGRVWLLGAVGTFSSPGVLRQDELDAGRVSFYDAYPGAGGGEARRLLGSASQQWFGEGTSARAMVWGGWRTLSLTQNFTGDAQDDVHGDATLQQHQALSGGLRLSGRWSPLDALALEGGLDGRVDLIDQSEQGLDRAGEVWGAASTLQGMQGSVGTWGGLSGVPLRGLTLQGGGRAEVLRVRTDQGEGWAPVLAPRASIVAEGRLPLRLHAAYGRGFRSPEARGVGDSDRMPVSLSDTVEVGATWSPSSRLEARLTPFVTWISDEILFDHVSARFLSTGATRRLGVDLAGTVRPLEALRIETVWTLSDGRYITTDTPIPYAPRLLGELGIYTDAAVWRETTWTAGVRGWGLAARPLPDGFASDPTGMIDLTARAERGAWSLELDVSNPLARTWTDGEFVFPSHWDPATPQSTLPVHHITAGSPPAARVTLGRTW